MTPNGEDTGTKNAQAFDARRREAAAVMNFMFLVTVVRLVDTKLQGTWALFVVGIERDKNGM
jgi:hypothetical protein